MKIVLREHVDHLGDRGQIVSVAKGYARNYLLPKGLAFAATPGNLKVLDQQRRIWEVKESRERAEAQKVADAIGTIELVFQRKSGEAGTLYGSVTASEIGEKLAERGIEVDRRRLVLTEPIKTLGEHQVRIRLHRDVVGQVKLRVEAEEPQD